MDNNNYNYNNFLIMKSVDRILLLALTVRYDSEVIRILESRKFLLVESGIHPKESGIPLTIANRNPRSNDKESEVQYLSPESKTVLDSLTRGKSAT